MADQELKQENCLKLRGVTTDINLIFMNILLAYYLAAWRFCSKRDSDKFENLNERAFFQNKNKSMNHY